MKLCSNDTARHDQVIRVGALLPQPVCLEHTGLVPHINNVFMQFHMLVRTRHVLCSCMLQCAELQAAISCAAGVLTYADLAIF